jgi:hypothetical protein
MLFLGMTTGVLVAGLAWAGPRGRAADLESAGRPDAALTRTHVDRGTGAQVDLRRDETGRIIVVASTPRVSVRRVLTRASSETILSAAGHRVTVTMAQGVIVVDADGRRWRGTLDRLEELDQAALELRTSAAARDAKALLDRMSLDPNTFEGNALLLTRGLLGTMWGDNAAVVSYQRWADASARAPRIVRARLPGGSPGECWDQYSIEAIRIANDLEDCFDTCSVLRLHCRLSCGFVYEVRAEAAFMWFTSCNGGFFVR